MIAEITLSVSSDASTEYVLSAKSQDLELSPAALAEKFPCLPVTPDAPTWETGERHRIIGGNMSGETKRELQGEFAVIRSLRPDIKNPLMCISIRKALADEVTPEQWREIVARVLKSLELQDCPHVIVQHRDKDDHVHILVSRIRLDGKVVSDSQSYRKVEAVMREVEVEFGFTSVQNSHDSINSSPTWCERTRFVEEGVLSPKMELQSRISRVLEAKPTATEFIAWLQAEHKIKVFPRLDTEGLPVGIAFGFGKAAMSGSTVGRGYAWKALLERGLTFTEQDIEAVRQVSKRAQHERQLVAAKDLNAVVTAAPADRKVEIAGKEPIIVKTDAAAGASRRGIDLLEADKRSLSEAKMLTVLKDVIQAENPFASPNVRTDVNLAPEVPFSESLSEAEHDRISVSDAVLPIGKQNDAEAPASTQTVVQASSPEIYSQTISAPPHEASEPNQTQQSREASPSAYGENGAKIELPIQASLPSAIQPRSVLSQSVASAPNTKLVAATKAERQQPSASIQQPEVSARQELSDSTSVVERTEPIASRSVTVSDAENASGVLDEAQAGKTQHLPAPDPSRESQKLTNFIIEASTVDELYKPEASVAAESKSQKRSVLDAVRAFFTSTKEELPVLDKYKAERVIARNSMDSYPVTVRAYSMLDEHIVNAAHGIKSKHREQNDLAGVLWNFVETPQEQITPGKNWMDVGREVAQRQGAYYVWGTLGRSAALDSIEAAKKEETELCDKAIRSYKAQHDFAPHPTVIETLREELKRLEQLPSSENVKAQIRQHNEECAPQKKLSEPATRLQELMLRVSNVEDADKLLLDLTERVELAVVNSIPIEQLAKSKPLPVATLPLPQSDRRQVMEQYGHVVEWAQAWHREQIGRDMRAEQQSILLQTILEQSERPPRDEDRSTVRMLAIKANVEVSAVQNRLEARLVCAVLAGTDRREVWGRAALEIGVRLETEEAVVREREAAARAREAMERQRAAEAATRFQAALLSVPPTADRIASPPAKHVVELSPQREKEIATKYAQPISFAEEQCRRAGETPTPHSRKALVAMLATHNAMPPTAPTLAAYSYLHEAKGEKAPSIENEVEALTLINNLKGTSTQFWLDTGRAAIEAGERMQQAEELTTVTIAAYKAAKGCDLNAKVQLTIKHKFILAADIPAADEQVTRITAQAQELNIAPPDFGSIISANYWLVQHSPDAQQKLVDFAETVEAQIAAREKLAFQLSPADPQQRAGLLFTNWIMQTTQLNQLQTDKQSQAYIEQTRRNDETWRAYSSAAQRHEDRYGVQPHPIMTAEQHAYLQQNKTSLNSFQREAFDESVVANVSPAKVALGKAPEPNLDHGQSLDF